MEFAILLFNKEEGHLGRVRGSDFSCSKVFFEEVLDGFLFVRREWVDFAYLRHKGLIQVDFMVIGMRRGNMVSGFFQEDLSKVSVL